MNLSRLSGSLGAKTEGMTRNRVLLASADSTNAVARRILGSFLDAELEPPSFLVVAAQQKAGRGRLKREWISLPDRGVYLSLATASKSQDELASLPLLVGAGLSRCISEICGCRCRLKWPNDLMVGGRKIGGILIECVTRGQAASGAVIGIGVNYAGSKEVSEVGGIGMDEVSQRLPELPDVVADIAAAVEVELEHIGDLAYAVACCREVSGHRPGDPIRFRTGKGVREGTFTRIDDRGHLILQSAEGAEVRLSAGDVVEERKDKRNES
jgi:BirA family biotin operon repressor/biotin-[acetyl-CoA-carboxylase] ligase